MGLRLAAWLPQSAAAKGGAKGEADIVLAVGQQVAEQVSIHPVGGEPHADLPRYVEVKTAAHAKEEFSIGLLRGGKRNLQEPEQWRQILGEGDICAFVNSPESGAGKKSDLLPLAQVKLRADGKCISGRFERHVDHAGSWRYGLVRDQQRRIDGLRSVDRTSATNHAVTECAEISAQPQPRPHGDTEIAFEAALREITGRADHIVEASKQGVTVDISLLGRCRQTRKTDRKAANQHTLHMLRTPSDCPYIASGAKGML
jgi:hypothetical protein